MANPQTRSDPIRERYFRPLETAEKWADWLFYIAAALSVAALLVEKQAYPRLYDATQIAFLFGVFAVFVLGHLVRLYFMPRADSKRRQDFLSSAYGVALSHEQTVGYYNNSQASATRRMAAQLLENSLFSKEIALAMARRERWAAVAYAAVWLAAVANRNSDLALVGVAAQAIFSEQIISRCLRLEWLRARFEKTYDDLYRLFRSNANPAEFEAMVLDSLGSYETGKATGAVTLCSKTFERLNPRLSAEWERVKSVLGL